MFIVFSLLFHVVVEETLTLPLNEGMPALRFQGYCVLPGLKTTHHTASSTALLRLWLCSGRP
jgi:hypothetical protein